MAFDREEGLVQTIASLFGRIRRRCEDVACKSETGSPEWGLPLFDCILLYISCISTNLSADNCLSG